jgi:hypothetical protein
MRKIERCVNHSVRATIAATRSSSPAPDVSATAAVIAAAPDSHPVTWFGWHVPALVEVGMVLLLGFAMMGVASRRFSRTD